MLKIVLILPGATDYDQQGRIQGSLNIPLNDEGAREVERITQPLQSVGIEIIYCSTCEPVLQTATTLAEALDVKLKQLPNMQNLDHGLWQGLLVDEVKLKQPKVYRQWLEQPESVCPPEGETVGEAKERVQAAMSKILKKHKSGVVGLVVPEPLASLVRAYLGGGELGDLWRAGAEHGNWELIECQPPQAARLGA